MNLAPSLSLSLCYLPGCCPAGGLEVSVSPSSKPLEEDSVVLRCKADSHLYRLLAWYRVANLSESEQANVQPCRSLTLQRRPLSRGVRPGSQGTDATLDLQLPSASRQDEGLYACQVENVKTQEKTCLLRRLSLQSKLKPHTQTCTM